MENNKIMSRFQEYLERQLSYREKERASEATGVLVTNPKTGEKEKKYPMPDKAHAKNAKARATQMYNAGKLSKSDYEKVIKKADTILG